MIHSTKTFYCLFLTRWEGKQGNVGEDILASAEESAMANFDFLSREEDLEDEDEVSGGGIVQFLYNSSDFRLIIFTHLDTYF